MYRDVDGPTKPLLDLNQACARIPVHIIFGGIKDIMFVFLIDILTTSAYKCSLVLDKKKFTTPWWIPIPDDTLHP